MKGYSLSDRGLSQVARINGKKIGKNPIDIECTSEEEIFQFLGIPYKTP